MSFHDYIKALRTRWILICVVTALGVLCAVAANLLITPQYQAATRLFVSTTSGSTLAETYQGNLFSQQRVVSYTQLLMGESLAQRTVDKLGLDMSARELQENINATAKLDTVLITVSVTDESPVRARDIANTLSDEFVEKVRELETPEPGAAPDARVVVEQRATLPDVPVAPKTNRNLLLGLCLGAMAGVAAAVLRDVLDNTIKEREALEEITGVGVVGTIPLSKERRKQAAISYENDNSGIAEAFRKLRTNLQFLSVDSPPRVIVFTSSMPHEGKSTTAINVALALAEAENNVLLVDGDMRRPMLSNYLNLVGSVGFSTVLSGGASLDEALQKTRFPGLTVLTSGPVPPNPSELLGSQSARKLLSDLRARFDYVIIDSTPLLAVTDAAIIAAGSDGVLVMARFGHTRRDQLSHAVKSLQDVGAHLLGAVLTMTPLRGAASYSYSYGYYGEQKLAEAPTRDRTTQGGSDVRASRQPEPRSRRARRSHTDQS